MRRSLMCFALASSAAVLATDAASGSGLNSDAPAGTAEPAQATAATAPATAGEATSDASAAASTTENVTGAGSATPSQTAAPAKPKAAAKPKAPAKPKAVAKSKDEPSDVADQIARALADGSHAVVWCMPGHERFRVGALVLVDDDTHTAIRAKGYARDAETAEISAALKTGTEIHWH